MCAKAISYCFESTELGDRVKVRHVQPIILKRLYAIVYQIRIFQQENYEYRVQITGNLSINLPVDACIEKVVGRSYGRRSETTCRSS